MITDSSAVKTSEGGKNLIIRRIYQGRPIPILGMDNIQGIHKFVEEGLDVFAGMEGISTLGEVDSWLKLGVLPRGSHLDGSGNANSLPILQLLQHTRCHPATHLVLFKDLPLYGIWTRSPKLLLHDLPNCFGTTPWEKDKVVEGGSCTAQCFVNPLSNVWAGIGIRDEWI